MGYLQFIPVFFFDAYLASLLFIFAFLPPDVEKILFSFFYGRNAVLRYGMVYNTFECFFMCLPLCMVICKASMLIFFNIYTCLVALNLNT